MSFPKMKKKNRYKTFLRNYFMGLCNDENESIIDLNLKKVLENKQQPGKQDEEKRKIEKEK